MNFELYLYVKVFIAGKLIQLHLLPRTYLFFSFECFNTIIYNSSSYPFYLALHLRLIIVESTSFLCAEVVTLVRAELVSRLFHQLQKFHSVHFVTVEDFTCKFL